ncbi:hypothetical protein [Sanguibacter sp. Z1732]|uniref:hypothetical protein n=1 Tax=Sanguibacter sp. Z1732 TaxID=3435412 RepID=UPI003D9C9358
MSTATVSIATICFDGFGDEDFHRTFTHAKQVGVRQIEFNAWYARNLTPAGLDSIVSRCREHDLTPASLQISPFAPGRMHRTWPGRRLDGCGCWKPPSAWACA